MTALIRTYKRLLHERPFVTNVMTTCTFMSTGDCASQYLFQDRELDLRQTARFALAGLLYVGPMVRGCLVLIDRLFGPTRNLTVLGKKMFVDQIVIAPCFLVGAITTLTLLRTQSFAEVRHELDHSYFSMLKLNYTFWPFVQMVNFYLIPLTYRVLFGSTAALGWNMLFSYRLHTLHPTTTDNKDSVAKSQ